MLAKITQAKLRSSTIIETVVAVLILLISFSIGMMIYNQVMQSTYSDSRLSANLEQDLVADSLIRSGVFETQVLKRKDLSYNIDFKTDENYPNLLILTMECQDQSGTRLAQLSRIIEKADEH